MDDSGSNQSPKAFSPGLHYLFWWMAGAPSDTISIDVTSGGSVVCPKVTGTMQGHNAFGDHVTFTL